MTVAVGRSSPARESLSADKPYALHEAINQQRICRKQAMHGTKNRRDASRYGSDQAKAALATSVCGSKHHDRCADGIMHSHAFPILHLFTQE